MTGRNRILRRMGYARDQEGIMHRYLEERANWEEHLQRTREFIAGAFKDPAIRTVAVLGSGWLLDVPLEELRERFNHVFLADVRHPPQIRKKTSSMENVTLLERDLSGGAMEQVWKASREGNLKEIRELAGNLVLVPPLREVDPDAIVSVNLLNQLDILLCDYLKRKGRSSVSAMEPLRNRLQTFHVDWITGRPGCLVTDTREVNISRDGKESSSSLLHVPLPEGFRTGHWEWKFDESGTYREGYQTRMEVSAVEWS